MNATPIPDFRGTVSLCTAVVCTSLNLEAAAWELDAALSKAEAIIARVWAVIAHPVMCGPNAIPSVPVAAIHAALEGET